MSRKFKSHQNPTKIKGTLREDVSTFLSASRWFLLRMRNFSNKSCIENQNTFYVVWLVSENLIIYEIMSKNMVKAERTQIMCACEWHAGSVNLRARTRSYTHTHTHTHTRTYALCPRPRVRSHACTYLVLLVFHGNSVFVIAPVSVSRTYKSSRVIDCCFLKKHNVINAVFLSHSVCHDAGFVNEISAVPALKWIVVWYCNNTLRQTQWRFPSQFRIVFPIWLCRCSRVAHRCVQHSYVYWVVLNCNLIVLSCALPCITIIRRRYVMSVSRSTRQWHRRLVEYDAV